MSERILSRELSKKIVELVIHEAMGSVHSTLNSKGTPRIHHSGWYVEGCSIMSTGRRIMRSRMTFAEFEYLNSSGLIALAEKEGKDDFYQLIDKGYSEYSKWLKRGQR